MLEKFCTPRYEDEAQTTQFDSHRQNITPVRCEPRDQSVKADKDKLRMELIPTSALKSLARVLTFGAKKYTANSWQQVSVDRYVGALLRHLVAYLDDPYGVDEESGLPHTEHLLCNAAFINDEVQRHLSSRP